MSSRDLVSVGTRRALATLAYTPLLLAPIVLFHTLAFALPWSPFRLPDLPHPLRFHASMIAGVWLFGLLAITACTSLFVHRHAPRSSDVAFRALTCWARAPAGIVWIGRGAIWVAVSGNTRMVRLAEVERVIVDLRWDNLVGVFLWRECYPITLLLRDGTTVSLFVFAARAFAEAVEEARRL